MQRQNEIMPFPIAASPKAKSTGTLDADNWTQAALTILARNGIEAVRIERLAKMLGVTKGSFYWHFKDRPALLEEMLRSWRQRATLGIIDRLESSDVPPAERLKELLKLMRNTPRAARGADIEAAIRLWGRSDPRVASVVQEIDRLRLGHLKSLVESAHEGRQDASARAVLIYAYFLAEAWIGNNLDAQTCAQCEAILEGL
jgi:AcrR family transcriptional regulator